MRFARIESGKVVEVGEFANIEGRFHPSLIWVECAPEVRVGWSFSGGVFTAPPAPTAADIRTAAVLRVKEIRKAALDRYVPSPGISDVYNENLTAAKAYLGGQGATTTMRDGTTATAYCTAKGSKMGYTADQFANYIVSENQRVALLASAVEEEYLRVAYAWLPAQTDPAVIAAAVTDYQTYCDARKP